MCQVTSNLYADSNAITLVEEDFSVGSLRIQNYTRPGKLFTGNQDLLLSRVGNLKAEPLERTIEAVVRILRKPYSRVIDELIG